jgi:hypothetical protein
MEDSEKENLYQTFKGAIKGIIDDKLKNPKNMELINNFKVRLNLGLQIEKDYYFWLHLIAENGNYTLERGKLEEYNLGVLVTPVDLMYWHNGQNSTFHMVTKKNKFGFKKFRFEKSHDGKRNLKILMKLPKVLVLDKIKKPNN